MADLIAATVIITVVIMYAIGISLMYKRAIGYRLLRWQRKQIEKNRSTKITAKVVKDARSEGFWDAVTWPSLAFTLYLDHNLDKIMRQLKYKSWHEVFHLPEHVYPAEERLEQLNRDTASDVKPVDSAKAKVYDYVTPSEPFFIQPPGEPIRRMNDLHFECPVCHMVSYNQNDIREMYCGNCHDYTGVNDPYCRLGSVISKMLEYREPTLKKRR